MTVRTWKQKLFPIIMVLSFLLVSFSSSTALAEKETYNNWDEVATAMCVYLDEAVEIYEAGGENAASDARDAINVAYFKFYEKLGFEKTVMGMISGKRGSEVEHQFYRAKRSIKNGESVEELQTEIDDLKVMLHEDAAVLDEMLFGGSDTSEEAEADSEGSGQDGTQATHKHSGAAGWGTFISVLGLTLREGLEAILVVAAIAAYLTKTNNRRYLKSVYGGALLGIVFSIALAILFNIIAESVGDAQSGIGQEIFEGCAMFLAVIVLFYVSNWMLSKSEVEVWNQYIQTKVEQSLTRGNMITLAFTAFLAVAREGAELILFFQGMRSNIANSPYHMWLGLGVAVLILAVVYYAIAKLSIRLPLKPFFIATSCLMFILCISFAGKGVFEFQEAGIIGRTIIPQMNGFTIQTLGIYPRVETLIPQVILLVVTILSVVYHKKNNERKRVELEAQQKNL